MKRKTKKQVTLTISKCCECEARYNGFVGLVDYGYTCNSCDKKCHTKEVVKTIWSY